MQPDTFLHGRRTRWADAPYELRSWVGDWVGPEREVRDCRGGMATGIAAVVGGERGRVFIKAADVGINPTAGAMYRREAAMATKLPRHRRIPPLLASAEIGLGSAGTWQAALYEAREGRAVRHPWGAADLDRVLTAWAELRPALTAMPWETSAQVSATFTGWREIACLYGDPWHRLSVEWAPREAELAEVVDGDGAAVLGHIDLRADNILIDDVGEVAFVDWAHPGLTAPWVDVALLLGDVVASGTAVECGGEIDVVETFARAEPGTDPRWFVSLVGALGAFLHVRAQQPVDPLLPHKQVWARAASQNLLRFIEEHSH